MTRSDYEKNWNAFSWEMSAATDSFFAVSGCGSWQKELISKSDKRASVNPSRFFAIIAVIVNAVSAYFFIAACRIREEKRSTLNLPRLISQARVLRLLDPAQEKKMQELLDKSCGTFRRLKKVRGMTVAHLEQPQNPFRLLEKEGVSRVDIISYLQDCSQVFSILGEPIGKRYSFNASIEGKSTEDLMRATLDHLASVV